MSHLLSLTLIIHICYSKLLWNGNFNNGWEAKWNLDANGNYNKNNRKVVSDPFGYFSDQVMQVTYPANTYASASGTGFLARPLGNDTAYDTLCINYYVAFASNFDWVLGGKLPGLFGDLGPDSEGEACRGGQQPNGTNCFSTRMMWRPQGEGEVYAYVLQPHPGSKDCTSSSNQYPTSQLQCCIECNGNDGESIGRGMFYMNRAVNGLNKNKIYNQITQQITMNDVGSINGVINAWHNSVHRIAFNGTEYRTDNTLKVRGIEFSTFFGGGSASYATPITTQAWFGNFSLYDDCMDILSEPVCDFNCNDRGICIGTNKCQCDNTDLNGDLCSCLYCNKYDIEIVPVIKECWVSGWILDLNIKNSNTKTVKSIDFNIEFPTNVSLTGYGSLSYKQINSTTYSTTLTKTINSNSNAQLTAMKTYPEASPLIIVTNVEFS
eukprot:399237_1